MSEYADYNAYIGNRFRAAGTARIEPCVWSGQFFRLLLLLLYVASYTVFSGRSHSIPDNLFSFISLAR